MLFIKKGVLIVFICIFFFWAIQMIPYGKNHINPQIRSEIQWNTPLTRSLFYKACSDCHSNETEWRWYGQIAPMSWVFENSVESGRAVFNVSEWVPERNVNNGKLAAKEVREGNMPLWYYGAVNPESWLSKENKESFISGLSSTFGE